MILQTETTQPRTLTVMTHDSFSISEELIAQFESVNHVTVSFVRSGDTGSALNQAILSRDNPLADVFYGVGQHVSSPAPLRKGSSNPMIPPCWIASPDEFQGRSRQLRFACGLWRCVHQCR